jgi:lauroyl/myristoyl acyltransferase
VWRDANDVYHAALRQIPFPAEGTRRERVTAYLEAEARAFERFVAEAPEQWLAVFHPIWPDLERAPAPKPAPADAADSTERLSREAAR